MLLYEKRKKLLTKFKVGQFVDYIRVPAGCLDQINQVQGITDNGLVFITNLKDPINGNIARSVPAEDLRDLTRDNVVHINK